MRMAIHATDDMVYIGDAPNCETRRSDCAALRAEGIRAVQFEGEQGVGQGEIEFIGHKKPNEAFTHFSRFQGYITQAQPGPPPPPFAKPEGGPPTEAQLRSMSNAANSQPGAGGVAAGHEHPDPEPPAADEDRKPAPRAKPTTRAPGEHKRGR